MCFISFVVIISYYAISNLFIFIVYFLLTAFALKKSVSYLQNKLTSNLILSDTHIEIEFPLIVSFFNISKAKKIIYYHEIDDIYIFDNYTKIFKIIASSEEYKFGVPFDESTNVEIINFIKNKKYELAKLKQ
jgi:hypothetical protein